MGTDMGTVVLLLLTQVVILQTPDVQNVFAGTALAAPLRNVVEANKINRQSQGQSWLYVVVSFYIFRNHLFKKGVEKIALFFP